MNSDSDNEGLVWQTGIWDKISDVYQEEVDHRFVPVVDGVIGRAQIKAGDHVLDLGTGTGSVALRLASVLGDEGRVVGHDISQDMLRIATQKANELHLTNIEFQEGRAESIPAEDSSFDVVLASLSLMYVIDRGTAAREIGRVLRTGGRFVAAVWAAANECDIVLFQQTAGGFAPPPPVPGVGPGAMADPSEFIGQLLTSGIQAQVEGQLLSFEFDDFESAWDVLAGVTTASLAPDIQEQAKNAVRNLMWNDAAGPRSFQNNTQFIIGQAQ
ncbi:MAG: methyltransferase domain-containing protein [Proteobacteria bacterium]|nr:methyltransferase domain-containing protein [Pseudomonadota bacterium]